MDNSGNPFRRNVSLKPDRHRIRGTVLVTIPEHPEQSFIACYDHELIIERHDTGRDTDTQVTIPVATIHRIFNEFEYLDWRDPDIIGTITFTGNLAYANHLAKACIRPSNWTMARFRRAERLHARKNYRDLTQVEYLHQPSQRQTLEAMEENRSVIITGLEPAPPCRDWTIDRLAESYGDAVVRVRSATQHPTMAEFVAELKNFEANPYDNMIEGFVKRYTEGANLPEEMWPDFGPLFFDREDFIPPQLWLGSVPTHIQPDIVAIMAAEIFAGEKAVTAAMREVGSNLKSAWRMQITGAGLGQRLARTIRSEQFPKASPSLNAAALVWSKAPVILGA